MFTKIIIAIIALTLTIGCNSLDYGDTNDAGIETQPDITPDTDQPDAGSPDGEVDTTPEFLPCMESADDRLAGCAFKSCTCDNDNTHAVCWLQDFGGNEVYTKNCITRHGQVCVQVGTCNCIK